MLNNFAKIYKIWIKSLGVLGKMPFFAKITLYEKKQGLYEK